MPATKWMTEEGRAAEEARDTAQQARRDAALAEANPEITTAVRARAAEIAAQKQRDEEADALIAAQAQLNDEQAAARKQESGREAVVTVGRLAYERDALLVKWEEALANVVSLGAQLVEARTQLVAAVDVARRSGVDCSSIPNGVSEPWAIRVRAQQLLRQDAQAALHGNV